MRCSAAFPYALAGLSAGVFPTTGLAQNVTPVAAPSLEPMIVTATLTQERVSEVPYTSHVLDKQRLQELSPAGFTEAFREIPGVMIQQTGHGQGSPFIRGFTGFRNLALIDGVRLNNSVFREGPNQYWSTIDPLSLSRIELVKGQGSVLHGSDSIGGTVNALTKGPAYADGPGVHTSGAVSTRLASAEESVTGRVEGSVSEAGSYGVLAGVTGRSFGDLRAADQGVLPNTGYDEHGVDTKGELFLGDTTKLTLSHNQLTQNDVWRTHRTIFAVPYEGSAIGNDLAHTFDQQRQLTYLKFEGAPDTWLDRYDLTLSHHLQTEDRFRRRTGGRHDLEGFDVDAFGLALNLESDSPIGKLSYGASHYLDQVDSYRRAYTGGALTSTGVQGPVGDDASYHLTGIFIQDQIPLHERLELTLGLRHTHAKADIGRAEDPVTAAPFQIRDSWNNLSANSRLLWTADEAKKLKLFAGLGQSFRAPNLSDLSRFDIARSGEQEVPSPNLEPETYLLSEVGARWEGKQASLSLTYFHTEISDMIVRAPTGAFIGPNAVVGKRNAGDGHVHGVELGGEWRFVEDWTLLGNLAWQEGEVAGFPTAAPVAVIEPLSRLLPLTGLIGLRYDSPGRSWWAEGSVQLTDRADRLSASDRADTQRIPPGGTPGHTLATLRAGWQATKQLTLTAAVENALDETYRIHGSGVNEPGTNFIFGAEMKF